MKYLEDVISKWDEHIKIQEEDKADYQEDHNELVKPFLNIIPAVHTQQTDKNSYQSPQRQRVLKESVTFKIQAQLGKQSTEKGEWQRGADP